MKYKVKNIIAYMVAIYTIFLFSACALEIYAQSTSKAEVEIIEGTGPTFPVNPEKPEENLPDGEEKHGQHTIVNITTFIFNNVRISAENKKYYMETELQPHIQIVDLRGTEVGWSVTASISPFNSGGKTTLKGAVIHIADGRPNSVVSDLYAPHQIMDVELTADGEPVKVITAPDGTGMGLWVMRWYPASGDNSYVALEIPVGSATIGHHSATITWVLNNTP